MKQLNSLAELNTIVEASFRKGCITNNFMLLNTYETYIKEGKLWVSFDDENTTFLLDKNDFYQLYYYLNDLSKPIKLNLDKPVVMEILYRGLGNEPHQVIAYWKNQGFIQHLSRDNMVASTDKIILSETQTNKLRIGLASNALDVEFANSLFNEALDKYTGDRLSFEELHALMKNKSLLCAYSDNELAGVLQFEIKNKVVWLGHIAIDARFRGKGIANELVKSYITLNASAENTRYALWVIQDNGPAVNLYRKFGFVYGNKSTVSLLKLN